jgi:hypothetical protein
MPVSFQRDVSSRIIYAAKEEDNINPKLPMNGKTASCEIWLPFRESAMPSKDWRFNDPRSLGRSTAPLALAAYSFYTRAKPHEGKVDECMEG